MDRCHRYLKDFAYGNQDISSGLTTFWLSSSLKISPEEQTLFLCNMLQKRLPISKKAFEFTRNILFLEQLPNGWKLFGKTGWSGSTPIARENGNLCQVGWFIGWIEKDDHAYVFSYNICTDSVELAQRIPRTKDLLMNSLATLC